MSSEAAVASTTVDSEFPTRFTRLSDQIYHLPAPTANGTTGTPLSSAGNDPDTILLFGWGDGTPRHVSKYVDGYRALFPNAAMVVVLATTLKAAYQVLPERTQGMMPVIDAVFPGDETKTREELAQAHGARHVLLHTMSNAGGVNLASTVNAYKTRFGGCATFPRGLLVFDSTPGGVVFSQQVWRWSNAMAIGTAKRFPWPFGVTRVMWYCFLWLNKFWETILRRHHAGAWSREAINRPEMWPPVEGKEGGAVSDQVQGGRRRRRLYLYSKEDAIIGWEDIEVHAAEARQLGYAVEVEVFAGTPHVGHMRKYPTEYWGAIKSNWTAAMTDKSE